MAPRSKAQQAGQAAAGAARTALNKAPGSKLAQGLQRVSPGVYRNAAGQLTNSGGKAMPGQASRLPQGGRGPGGMAQGVAQGVGAAIGGQPRGGGMGGAAGAAAGAAMRPPMPRGGGMAAGIGQGIGAGLGGMGKGAAPIGRPSYLDVQGQLGDLRQQAGMTDQQMNDFMRQFEQQQQQGGGAGMGQQFGEMPQQFGGMPNGQMPGLEEQARARAEAMMRGDAVTMDYNPQREALVDQYLQQMGRPPMGGMSKPGTVSGMLQQGPAQRPNPFQGFAQGIGQQFGGMPMNPYKR